MRQHVKWGENENMQKSEKILRANIGSVDKEIFSDCISGISGTSRYLMQGILGG